MKLGFRARRVIFQKRQEAWQLDKAKIALDIKKKNWRKVAQILKDILITKIRIFRQRTIRIFNSQFFVALEGFIIEGHDPDSL